MKNILLVHPRIFIQLIFLFFLLFVLTGSSLAMEEPEKKAPEEAGLAAVWIITQVSQGGYLKPAVNFTMLDKNASLLWEIEAGWRFSNWFKFGAGLKRTLTELSSEHNHATLFGLVAGASGRNPLVGNFTLDLTVGSFDTGDLDNAHLYIEPGFHIKQRLYKKTVWIGGISYRYVDNQSISLFGNNSFNSFNFKFAIANDKY